METLPEFAGRLLPAVLFACLALYFLIRGATAGPGSRRLANLALFCGLTGLVLPEISLGLSPATNSALFLASGAIRIFLGVAGITLAAAALWTRGDGGVGIARPVTAAGFSFLHAFIGAGLVLFSSFTWASTPWDFQSPDGAFRLRLPSQQWKQAPVDDRADAIAFVCSSPRMQARVVAVRQEQTAADFALAVEALRARLDSLPTRRDTAEDREGTTTSGGSYRYVTFMDSTPDGNPVFVAYSVTWCPRQQTVIEVLVEGLPRLLSQTGKAGEMHRFQKSAETICLSVE